MTREMLSKVSIIEITTELFSICFYFGDPLSDLCFLTDMLFDEDTTLLSFFGNFSDPEDEDELKENIIKYVGGGNFGGA